METKTQFSVTQLPDDCNGTQMCCLCTVISSDIFKFSSLGFTSRRLVRQSRMPCLPNGSVRFLNLTAAPSRSARRSKSCRLFRWRLTGDILSAYGSPRLAVLSWLVTGGNCQCPTQTQDVCRGHANLAVMGSTPPCQLRPRFSRDDPLATILFFLVGPCEQSPLGWKSKYA